MILYKLARIAGQLIHYGRFAIGLMIAVAITPAHAVSSTIENDCLIEPAQGWKVHQSGSTIIATPVERPKFGRSVLHVGVRDVKPGENLKQISDYISKRRKFTLDSLESITDMPSKVPEFSDLTLYRTDSERFGTLMGYASFESEFIASTAATGTLQGCLHVRQIVTVVGDKLYIVTCEGTQGIFADYAPAFDKMIGVMKLTPQKQTAP